MKKLALVLALSVLAVSAFAEVTVTQVNTEVTKFNKKFRLKKRSSFSRTTIPFKLKKQKSHRKGHCKGGTCFFQ